MMDLDFDARVRAAARASVDAVAVPAVPGALRHGRDARALRALRGGVSRRRALQWWGAAAAGVAIALTGATDGGRAAIANAVEHTIKVFTLDPASGRRNVATSISMSDALATTAFRVVAPSGLPATARLLSIQRTGDPESGHPAVVFQYDVAGRPLEVAEMAARSDQGASQKVRASGAALPERHDPSVRIRGPQFPARIILFRTGQTEVILSAADGGQALAQLEAIRSAMTRS
jgi:hypothetical protein